MIYYTLPADQYAGHGFPYIFTPENQERLKSEVAVMPGDQLSKYDYFRFGNYIEKGGNYFENLIYNMIYIFFGILSVILLIVMSIIYVRQNNKRLIFES